MPAAPHPFMTYAMTRDWLRKLGIPESRFRALIQKGVIKPRHLAGKRNYYNAEQIERDVLNGEGK